jgi:hypothetical protein
MTTTSRRIRSLTLVSILAASAAMAVSSAPSAQAGGASNAKKFDWANEAIPDPCFDSAPIKLVKGSADIKDGKSTRHVGLGRVAVGDVNGDKVDDSVVEFSCIAGSGGTTVMAYRFDGPAPEVLAPIPSEIFKDSLSKLTIAGGVVTLTWKSSGTERYKWASDKFVAAPQPKKRK